MERRTFLVEVFLSQRETEGATELEARVAADRGIRIVQSTYVPADEAWLLVCEARTTESLAAALSRAGIAADRVVEALDGTSERLSPIAPQPRGRI